ncbi:hypothetical protein [Thioalkalivibrio sp. ALJT]|uniref:hypothetical protein n=1 Tax=Thioalkalivibrio sp. ALJT TaxID=1158146 RepID=UPI00035D1F4F|nr:hypothetical protein [Thioalkalivibrio sp. ALJT]
MIVRSVVSTFLVLTSAPALAHPGHGHGEGHSLLHYLSSPEHVWPLALLLVALVGLGGWLWRRSRRRNNARS